MAKIVNFCQLMFKLGKGVGAASRRHRFLGDGKGDRSFGWRKAIALLGMEMAIALCVFVNIKIIGSGGDI